jgi:transposase-like protein
VLAVRWYLRYGLSYRDVEEVLAERGVGVDYIKLPSAFVTQGSEARPQP